MKVLLTNDDGVYAPGLMALHKELSKDFDVLVVAPESEMSAVGHGITLSSPLRLRRINLNGTFYGFGLTGTPADCVKISVQELMGEPPDIVLSGINMGANVGVNVLYSGTVSAAAEGAFLGIRSAAISLDARQNADFRFAARFAREVIGFITKFGLAEKTALNVNIPALPPRRIAGVTIAKQGLGRFREKYERRVDPRGEYYYWLSGDSTDKEDVADSDAKSLKDGFITITPISYDLTCHEEVARLRACPLPDLREIASKKNNSRPRRSKTHGSDKRNQTRVPSSPNPGGRRRHTS